MNYRYIVLVECDSGHEAHATQQAALSEMGMKSRLLQGAVRLFVSRDTPTLPIPGHGAIIGHVFTREGQPVTEALAFMQCRDYAELEKHLLENCWGDYILIHSSGASGRPLNILRDPSGGLPCVYSFQGSNGFITSSISIAIRLNLCRRQVDWAYISHGLTFPYLRTARTGLSEISELLPGCSLNLHGAVAVVRLAWSPWTFVAAGQRYGSPEEAAANVRQAVASTVRALAELDGDILLELSGGLDSSIVAACLRDVDVRVTCCTVVTPLPGEDEQHYAKQMTDHLGTDLHSLNVSSKDAHFHFTPSPDAVAPGMGILHQTSYELLSAAGNTHRVNSFFSGAGGDSVLAT
ncbi:asparagine synthase-related protein [Xanthomonas hortorum]|uniref:asparagine synthase-related protein n=1 Tax=Xanthomonas hortorum TaxID=56454 RepID=UPI0032E8A81F